MEICPKCQSRRIHRSRTRSAFERFRRTITGKRPFRCSECGWRGWAADIGIPEGAGTAGRDDLHADKPAPDLDAIDAGMK